MSRLRNRIQQRRRRHQRIRRRIRGTAERPRMVVNATNKHLYVQFIDDVQGHTVASASTMEAEVRGQHVSNTVDGAHKLGKIAGERVVQSGVTTVVFDRAGFQFHGKVKAMADGAREAGLQF